MRMSPGRPQWAFVTSHGAMLIEVARNPDATVKQLAARVILTERQAHRVLADLVDAGYVTRERIGRRNRYRIHADRKMRYPALLQHKVGDLLEPLAR